MLEKLPKDGEGKSDPANVAEAVDAGDMAGGDVRLRLGAEENHGGEALHLHKGGNNVLVIFRRPRLEFARSKVFWIWVL